MQLIGLILTTMATRAISNKTIISKKILQSLGWFNSFRQTAGAASGVIANRPMTTDTDAAARNEKSINVDHRPATSPAPSRRNRRQDDFVPAFFSDPWDPFNPGRTLSQVLNYMDQLMDASLSGRGLPRTGWDAREDNKSLYLKVEMPGLSKDDVKVWLEGKTLVIKGEREEENQIDNAEDNTIATKGDQGQVQEQWRARQRYSTRIEIPERGYQLDQIKAEMKHGVLRVVIPKAQERDQGDVIEVKIDG